MTKKRNMRRTYWPRLFLDTALLSLTAQHVVSLRLLRLMKGGPRSLIEAQRMVAEKMSATTEAALALGTGKTASHVVRRLQSRVNANKRRLS